MKWRRGILLFLLFAVIIVLVAYGFVSKRVPVSVVEVTRGALRSTVKEEGKTRVKDRFVVSAPVAGFALRMELDVGDPVAMGQVVAKMEPQRSRVLDPRSRAEAEARVEAAKAALGAAEENVIAASADAKYATAEFDRIKKLFDGHVAPLASMEQAEARARHAGADLKSARFGVEVARFELEAAETALKYSATGGADGKATLAIRAPVSGSVLGIYQESEAVVAEGQQILSIGDPRSLEVEVDVLSADAVRIRPGMPVLFDRWGGEAALVGRVSVVEPAGFTKVSALGVEEQRVLVISEITSPPELWDTLGDGYRVEASFILWEGADILQVPTSALFRFGEGWATFVVEDNRTRLRSVKTGHRGGLSTEVLTGLKEGEAVVTHPDDTIEDGTRVRLR